MTSFLPQKRLFVFCFFMKTHPKFEKQIFCEEFYRHQVELIRMFGINHVLRLNKNWPVDNLIEPYISGYKLLNEWTSGILKVFDFHHNKLNFPKNFWDNDNSTVDDSNVLLIILLLFSLRLSVWVDRIKATSFHVCFVHEYNFHTFYMTEKARTKH